MDLFESIDSAVANDPAYDAAVAEVNACYAELSKMPSDSKSVFDRLNKAAAIVRNKLAERDAKRDASAGLGPKEGKELRAKADMASLKKTMDGVAHAASEGDETAQHLVEAKAEIEESTGKTIEKIFENILKH